MFLYKLNLLYRLDTCLFLKILLPSYKHAIDGMARVYREEGLKNLFSGADWATGRLEPFKPFYD